MAAPDRARGDDGLTQRTVHLTVVDKQGTRYGLRGDVLRVADIGRRPGP